jgi:hypothetical protein
VISCPPPFCLSATEYPHMELALHHGLVVVVIIMIAVFAYNVFKGLGE